MRVDVAEVAQAARRLEAEGRAVSTRAVREITGGSLRDVAPLVKRWRAERTREVTAGQGAGDALQRAPDTDDVVGEHEPGARNTAPLPGKLAEIEARLAARAEAATEAAERAAGEIGRLQGAVTELVAVLKALHEELAYLRAGRAEAEGCGSSAAESALEGDEGSSRREGSA